jgi:hypothetical protein
MSFAKLYEAAQKQRGRISTKWLKEEAIALSEIIAVKEQWSSVIDASTVRGFYIEGPLGPPIPLKEKEALIVLSRDMCRGHLGDHWRRFVFTKELMHVFDREDEKADTAEKFDLQIEKFGDPAAAGSPQFRAEVKAYWRALAVLCQEDQRLAYKAELDAASMSLEVIASALHLPAQHTRSLLREDLPNIVGHVLAEK